MRARWSGTWPIEPDAPAPPPGPVVYWQRDARGKIRYVGSTGDLLTRMRAHPVAGRTGTWAQWEARACPTRRAAYAAETAEIRALAPPENVKRGAGYVRSHSRWRASLTKGTRHRDVIA